MYCYLHFLVQLHLLTHSHNLRPRFFDLLDYTRQPPLASQLLSMCTSFLYSRLEHWVDPQCQIKAWMGDIVRILPWRTRSRLNYLDYPPISKVGFLKKQDLEIQCDKCNYDGGWNIVTSRISLNLLHQPNFNI